jgi:uncharacterized protein (TIGR03545 family)
MMRLSLRWQLVVPRLLLVAVGLLAAQYALGLAARWYAAGIGTSALATRFEVGAARVSPMDRQVVLGALRLADPHRPTKNLFEAERCELNVAVAPLLQKRVVIDRGRVTGLRLGDPKSDPAEAGNLPAGAPCATWLTKDADHSAREWLAQLSRQFQRPPIERFESFARSEALSARWPGQCAALFQRAAELKRRAAQLQQATDAAETNPLRHAEFFAALPGETARLHQEFEKLGAELEECSVSLEAERRAIVAARKRDERRYCQQLQLEAVDADALTAYLLRRQLAAPLDELIGWLRWARRIVPAKTAGPRREQQAAERLALGGATPNFLIRALRLEGTAHVGGRAVEFRGLLADVTNSPSRHNVPMRLRLASGGDSLPLELQATIDRTAAARDELLVDCRGIALPKLWLGRAGEFELCLGPSSGSISISVVVEDEELSGDIQVVQKNVVITPAMHGELRDVRLVEPLAATLGKVDSFATRVAVRGTLEEPSCTLWSNLGPAVAEALHRAQRQAAGAHAEAVLADVRRRVDERLADSERQFAQARAKVAADLTGLARQVDAIARREKSGGRIAVERLGGRLSSGALSR